MTSDKSFLNSSSSPSAGLLRFSTAGSVDDGKSTLIGRLLFDSKQIFEDQLEALQRSSDLTGGGILNLANLTDGLKAEREQGITIDVAYRYFATPRRKFIVADTPGHIQYTRNMVTGSSTANLTIVLIDVRQGVTEQTRRHAFIASLLRVPHLVVCINKMDILNFSYEKFQKIVRDFKEFSNKLRFQTIQFIPISALLGDNVVEDSKNMPWYKGPSLLQYLEEVDIDVREELEDPRFPVQYIIRPHSDSAEYHDFRGFAGRIASGVFRVGDPVMVLPSRKISQITEIYTYNGKLDSAKAPMSVALLLRDDLDISRGDLIVHPDKLPRVTQEVEATVCWMAEEPLRADQRYYVKHLTKTTRCMITRLENRIDIRSFEPEKNVLSLGLNEIGTVRFRTMNPITYDPYEKDRTMGGFILIDEATNATVGAGMIKG